MAQEDDPTIEMVYVVIGFILITLICTIIVGKIKEYALNYGQDEVKTDLYKNEIASICSEIRTNAHVTRDIDFKHKVESSELIRFFRTYCFPGSVGNKLGVSEDCGDAEGDYTLKWCLESVLSGKQTITVVRSADENYEIKVK